MSEAGAGDGGRRRRHRGGGGRERQPPRTPASISVPAEQGASGLRLGSLQAAAWRPSPHTTAPAGGLTAPTQGGHTDGTECRALTTMTRTTGPAKLQMRGSWTEIQQKSGFP